MDQNRAQNAAHRINGYFIPRADEATVPAFERAKAEAITNMKRDIADIEAMTVEQFIPRCETPSHAHFDENDCGGVFDGNGVISDADPGL